MTYVHLDIISYLYITQNINLLLIFSSNLSFLHHTTFWTTHHFIGYYLTHHYFQFSKEKEIPTEDAKTSEKPKESVSENEESPESDMGN